MRVSQRIPFVTRPCRRLPPKIPNPLPKTSSKGIPTEYNCIFYNLQARAAPPPQLLDQLPPLLKNPVGRPITPTELDRMRELRRQDPRRWTITALAGEFKINRGYIIKHVLSKEEQKMAEDELHQHVDYLTFGEKRGWLMRYKIREHRQDIW